MALIRFRQRHIHRTMVDVLTRGLTELGWVDEPVNFSATPLTILDHQPEERGEAVAPDTVAITMGDEPADTEEELGAAFGGLQSVSIPLFVDIYGEKHGTSVAIGNDVKDLLKHKVLPLRDWTTQDAPVVPGVQIEITEVIGPERPGAGGSSIEDFKRYWRVMNVMTTTYFTT